MTALGPPPHRQIIGADSLRSASCGDPKVQMRQRIAGKYVGVEQLQEREQRRQELAEKMAKAIATAERDAPIRVRFHVWLERMGYRDMPIPEPGHSYSGSHIQSMWEAYLDATLEERGRS